MGQVTRLQSVEEKIGQEDRNGCRQVFKYFLLREIKKGEIWLTEGDSE